MGLVLAGNQRDERNPLLCQDSLLVKILLIEPREDARDE
jgi:hypothetical protein